MEQKEPFFTSYREACNFYKARRQNSSEEQISDNYRLSDRSLKRENSKFMQYMHEWVRDAYCEGGIKGVKTTLELKAKDNALPLEPLEDIEDIISDIQFQIDKEQTKMPEGAEFEVFTGITQENLLFSKRGKRFVRFYATGAIPRRPV